MCQKICPKINEVWKTKAGRLALIVDGYGGLNLAPDQVAFLWFDEIMLEFTVSLANTDSNGCRLAEKQEGMSPADFFKNCEEISRKHSM